MTKVQLQLLRSWYGAEKCSCCPCCEHEYCEYCSPQKAGVYTDLDEFVSLLTAAEVALYEYIGECSYRELNTWITNDDYHEMVYTNSYMDSLED